MDPLHCPCRSTVQQLIGLRLPAVGSVKRSVRDLQCEFREKNAAAARATRLCKMESELPRAIRGAVRSALETDARGPARPSRPAPPRQAARARRHGHAAGAPPARRRREGARCARPPLAPSAPAPLRVGATASRPPSGGGPPWPLRPAKPSPPRPRRRCSRRRGEAKGPSVRRSGHGSPSSALESPRRLAIAAAAPASRAHAASTAAPRRTRPRAGTPDRDRKSTRLNSSHMVQSRMPSSA